MGKKDIFNYQTTDDFILDKKFCSWVLHPNEETNSYWELFRKENPEREADIQDAILIVKSIQPLDKEVSQQQLDRIFRKIHKPVKKTKLNWLVPLKYAAMVAFIIGAGSLAYYSISFRNEFPPEMQGEIASKGKVILADGTTKEFETEQTTITQTNSGNLAIDSDTIRVDSNRKSSALNQVIIPYGKRSEITLIDGTRIWLNSGSQLSYPSQFKNDSREIYLSGEAMFDVKHDPKKPFYVITRDVKIKVLGTTFNVLSYADDNTVETVLIKGKVTAGKNRLFAETVELSPGERLIYDKAKANLSKDKVDVQLYSSWVDGYLVFKNIPVTEVFMKLKRYYNQEITIDNSLSGITFSGKLDLSDKLEDVLKNIAFASSVNVYENNGSFDIKK